MAADMEQIVKIQGEDYRDLATFLTSYWKVDIRYWLERFSFIWDKNPAFNDDSSRGFLVKRNNEILGFLGNLPIKFQLGYREVITSNGFSLLLDAKLRGTGLGKQMVNRFTETYKNNLAITTTPNMITLNLVKMMGYQLLPRGIGNHNIYSLVPINSVGTLKFYFNLTKNSKSPKSIINTKDNLILLSRGIITRRFIEHKKDNNFKVTKVEKVNEDFDELWENTRSEYANTNIRNSEILNWYLLPTVDADREIYAAYQDRKLSGFIVVRCTQFKGTRLFLCVDLWTKNENRNHIIRDLITFSVKQAFMKNCDALLLPHFSNYLSNIYKSMGVGYKAIGKQRNDLFLPPKDIEYHMTELNSYITYINGDRFLGRNAV